MVAPTEVCCVSCNSPVQGDVCELCLCNVSPAALQVLREMHQIKPAFPVWAKSGERGHYVCNETPEEQPALAYEDPEDSSCAIYIGDLDDVCNDYSLWLRNIRTVVNLCPEQLGTSNYKYLPGHLAEQGIVMLCWPADDTSHFDILRHVGEAGCFDFIQQRLQQGSVLVNCWGVSIGAAQWWLGF